MTKAQEGPYHLKVYFNLTTPTRLQNWIQPKATVMHFMKSWSKKPIWNWQFWGEKKLSGQCSCINFHSKRCKSLTQCLFIDPHTSELVPEYFCVCVHLHFQHTLLVVSIPFLCLSSENYLNQIVKKSRAGFWGIKPALNFLTIFFGNCNFSTYICELLWARTTPVLQQETKSYNSFWLRKQNWPTQLRQKILHRECTGFMLSAK